MKCTKCNKPCVNRKIVEQDNKAVLIYNCRVCDNVEKISYSIDFDKIIEYINELDRYLDKYKI